MFEFKEDNRMPLLKEGELQLYPEAQKLLEQDEINELMVSHLMGDYGMQCKIEIVTYDEILNYREKDIQPNFTLKNKGVFVVTERDMNQSTIINCTCVECGKGYLVDRNDMDFIGLPVFDEEEDEIIFIPTDEGRYGFNKNKCKTCLFEQIERL